MGAYLNTPVREKESRDFDGEFLSFGASSMQGWRMTQEDAHSCQLDFDPNNKTTLFAVYDGHGGAEVAQYASMHFPNYLKKTEHYQKGLVSEALEEAFLGFDATLTEECVIRNLQDLAGVEHESNDEADEEVKNEAAALCEEASMPLEKVLERYGGPSCAGSAMGKSIYSLRKRQKFQSPLVRTKPLKSSTSEEDSTTAASSSSSSVKCDLDEVKSNLEDKLVNGFCEADAAAVKSQPDSGVDSLKVEPDSNLDENKSKSLLIADNFSAKHETNNEPKISSEAISNIDNEKSNSEKSTKKEKIEASSSGNELKTDIREVASSDESSLLSVRSDLTDSLNVEMEACSSDACGSNSKAEKKYTEEDDDEESDEEDSDDSDDDDKWNSEEAEDSDDDDDVDGFKFDDDEEEDEDDEDEADEEGAISSMGWDEEPGSDSGCTAVVALLREDELYVANAGDSRCVVCRDGKAVEMSMDHKPEDEPEMERILKAGGKVTCDGRVNGGLNLSRALGDHSYKKNVGLSSREQMITALPDIRKINLCEKDQFMVLACDGIWNVMSSQDVVDFVQRQLYEGVTKLSAICEEMFDFCLAPDTSGDGTGCDNMTCVIVRFNKLQQKSSDEQKSQRKRKADDAMIEKPSVVKRNKESPEEEDSKEL